MLILATILATVLYGTIALISVIGVKRFSTGDVVPVSKDILPSVSIVVAARNEEAAITDCIQALLAQDYRGECEIIIVDDESTDRTRSIAELFEDGDQFRVLTTEGSSSTLTGKSRPLDAGFHASRFPLIATTDADCTPPSTWLNELASYAQANKTVDMVCGCTVVHGTGIASKIQRIDWLHLLCIAAGLNSIGVPLTAMGNNMLFRKECYLNLGGFNEMGTTLTEDFHFYRSLARKNRDSVSILPIRSARNITAGEGALVDLAQQKKRWLVGGLSAPAWVWIMYLTFFIAHVGLLAVFAVDPLIAAVLLTAKILSDVALVRTLGRRLGESVPWSLLPLFQLYQFAGVVLIPLLLIFDRRVAWKGRSHPVSQLSSTS